jgi:prolyl oligopeptidase
MRISIILLVVLLTSACKNQTNQNMTIQYPNTKSDSTVDNYFGKIIADPYRWLEVDTAVEVVDWVKKQNACTEDYLNKIPFREEIKKRLTKIWNYERLGTPFTEGEDLYFFKNDGLQNQSILYKQKGSNGAAEVFLDPNKLSDDGTVSLSGITFSKDHQYIAVSIAKSGSDWNEIFVLETKTGKRLNDQIQWVKFSNATWKGNGFYYSCYDAPKAGKALSGQNEFMKIYYHELGQNQSEDKLVYEDKLHPLRYFNASVSDDEKYLFINCSEGTSGSEIWFKDLKQNQGNFHLLFKGFKNNFSIVDNINDKVLVHTDFNAPNYQLVLVDPLHSEPSNWQVVIGENKNLLEQVTTCGGKLFATYLQDEAPVCINIILKEF